MRTDYRFGDILRVDPANPMVEQPDDRRWMYVGPKSSSQNHLTLYISPGKWTGMSALIPWSDQSLLGFIVVEDDEQ